MLQSVAEILVGALVAILTTIAIESLRKPRLSMQLASSHDNVYSNRPATHARFLAIELHNHNLPWFAKWMSRTPALHTHGWITFHHLDGQNVSGRAMTIRWSGTPEPIGTHLQVGNASLTIFEQPSLAVSTTTDVYPGEYVRLDVAARFDNEPDSYGWSNDNYFSQPVWRDPKWKLALGRYLVHVTIVSSGDKCTRLFRLINDGPQSDFRLEDALPLDIIHA